MDAAHADIQRTYSDALKHVEGDGLAGRAGYSEDERRHGVVSFGCGNPLAFAEVSPGDTVLDLGCGGGLDLIMAAERVGEEGRVIGVDVTDALVELARANVARAGFADRVDVRWGLIESLPVESASVDWVISNCVVNLSPDKGRVFEQIARVLKPGGRMRISDIVVEGAPPRWAMSVASLFSSGVKAAVGQQVYLEGLRAAGLEHVEIVTKQVYSGAELRGMAQGFGPWWARRLLSSPVGQRLERVADGRATSVRVHASKPTGVSP